MQEFSSVAVMDDSGPAINLSLAGGHAAQINSLRVSEGYFRTLGAMPPPVGRAFTADEDRPGGGRAAILGHGLWTRVFAGDPSIVGRAVRINQETFTVVGVMPASFAATTGDGTRRLRNSRYLVAAATGPQRSRLRGRQLPDDRAPSSRGFPRSGAAASPRSSAGVLQQVPRLHEWVDDGHSLHDFRAWHLQDVLVSQVRRSLLTVMGAVAAVLLLACLNLAGLMLARSMRRAREFAVRSALGATRAQIIRLLVSEGIVLAVGGGILGVVVARAATGLLMHAAPLALPAVHGSFNAWLLASVVLAIVLVATCIVSFVPALLVVRRGKGDTKLGSQSIGETVSQARFSRALIVAQVGLSMVLLCMASQLLGTFLKLRALPSGVEPRQLAVFQVALKGDPYANTRHTSQFVNAVVDELRHQPGVDSVAAINGLPLDRGLNIGGYPVNHRDLSQIVEFRTVTPGYFRAMGIPLLEGRDIADSDRADGDRVVVIGAAAAHRYWPDRFPIGESFRVANDQNWRIVGVVADVKLIRCSIPRTWFSTPPWPNSPMSSRA